MSGFTVMADDLEITLVLGEVAITVSAWSPVAICTVMHIGLLYK
ncbi:hypothetical protein HAPAU_31840 [Halalkalicoccus paucihalophilus]|uniref:Uncharacterized protein n=1 Tax=Halalkalicoccus paucihalophilus TaxID=1008153 RepID=A0A151ABQ9_9EURY|nr:hypothetical protein HAPAU_31840 [Halalkalicoccus paucihalophilus]